MRQLQEIAASLDHLVVITELYVLLNKGIFLKYDTISSF
jgi:hypothetical protein